jgi:hypothetical protein
VLRDGLRLVEQREAEDASKLKAYRQRLASALVHWIEANSKNLEISKTCKPI